MLLKLFFSSSLFTVTCCLLQFNSDCFVDCWFYGSHAKCGTDGHTYTNKCYLNKVRCHGGPAVHVSHDGPCMTKLETHPPPITHEPTVTAQPITSSHSEPVTSSEQPSTSNQRPLPSTFEPVTSEVLDFLCIELSRQDCSPTVDMICGTDGFTYLNYCEFEKSRCMHRVLAIKAYGEC